MGVRRGQLERDMMEVSRIRRCSFLSPSLSLLLFLFFLTVEEQDNFRENRHF